MMSKILTNRDTFYLIKLKTLWEKEKLLITSNFSFSSNVFKRCLLLTRQTEYVWSKGLTTLEKKPFENIVGKGEYAGNKHFLLFPHCFLGSQKKFNHSISLFVVS